MERERKKEEGGLAAYQEEGNPTYFLLQPLPRKGGDVVSEKRRGGVYFLFDKKRGSSPL